MERFSGQLYFLQNVGRLGGPDERLWRLVGGSDVRLDGGDQRPDVGEHAAFQSFAGQVAEESLDHVQPTGAGGREVNVEAWMPLEPVHHLRMLVRRVIVNDQ